MNNKKLAVLEKMKEVSGDLNSLITIMKESKISRIHNMAEQLDNIKLLKQTHVSENTPAIYVIPAENTVGTTDEIINSLQEETVSIEYNKPLEYIENETLQEEYQDTSEEVLDVEHYSSVIEKEKPEVLIDNAFEVEKEEYSEVSEEVRIEIPEEITVNNIDSEIVEIVSINIEQDLALSENAIADPRSSLRSENTPSEEYAIQEEYFTSEEKEKEETKAIDEMAESQEIYQQLEAENSIVDEIVEDASIVEIMIEDYQEKSPAIQKEIELLNINDTENTKALLRDLHTLKGNLGAFGALRGRNEVHKLENKVLSFSEGRIELSLIHPELTGRFENIMNLIDAHISGDFSYKIVNYDLDLYTKKDTKAKVVNEKELPVIDKEKAIAVELTKEELELYNILLEEDEDIIDEIDHEIMPIFIEDSVELLPKIRNNLERLPEEDPGVISELHRDLHTLKGGVGMVGAKRARKEVHKMENIMLEVQNGRLSGKSVCLEIENRFENIMKLLDAFAIGDYNYKLENYDLLILQEKMDNKDDKKESVYKTQDLSPVVSSTVNVPANTQQTQKIRIDAEIINKLINEANEVKLSRNLLLNTSKNVESSLKLLEENIEHLTRMYRELEIHSETQIQSKSSQLEDRGEDFDPLELDRFTRLQELTRFFNEGINDTSDLYQALVKISSEISTALAYQERSINEFYGTLAQTRLVPFSGFEDKFRRVVKRTEKELGKAIDFIVEDGGIELDRFILEKLQSPMEHILRNSVSHGIELPESRIENGKNPVGQITINVKQDTGKIYISIKDDGTGIQIERVRKKAIEKNLWEEGQPMTNKQAAEMVCLASFSTADKVSEIAGRGVGMDVVKNDILALGGNFDLNSIEGKGLTVNIQVPTTMATIWALIVNVADEEIALPVDLVDNVCMLSKKELEEGLNKGFITVKTSDGDDKVVDFRPLSAVMDLRVANKDYKSYNHVVVLKTDNQYMAVSVNEMSSVKEVPMRPIGKMLSNLPGIIGVTILSNGKAAYVMDVIRARSKIMRENNIAYNIDNLMPINIMNNDMEELTLQDLIPKIPLVMVVDDSLTVRKATSRFLEKEGFDYALAKDGQDALEKLSTINPSVILLDVEMPRMDGFEFAKNVREHQRHSRVPIIMITSRIAEKHRLNAEALGVNEYVGKPFKEEEMLTLLKKYIR